MRPRAVSRPKPLYGGEFHVRTFDTSQLDDEAQPDEEPEAPAPVQQAAAPEDSFTTVTVEPYVLPRAPSAPPKVARRRRKGRERRQPRIWWATIKTSVAMVAAALLVATIFSLWTPLPADFRAGLSQVQATQHVINYQPSPLPTDIREVRIGIIAGHSGPPQDAEFSVDPGAVCDDGLTELGINTSVAEAVVAALRRDGYSVDPPLQEFDPRLKNYQADVLISIHTNSCDDYGEGGTGFAVASAASRGTTSGQDERLLNCMVQYYGQTTGLPRHFGVTRDMTEYHNFSEVSTDTPTAIVEIGFMRLDRNILTQQPELIAQGVANGIRCFLRPDIYGDPVVEPNQ